MKATTTTTIPTIPTTTIPTPTTTPTTNAPETAAETPVTPEKPGTWESIELSADRLEDTIERIVHEGTVRRIVVKHDGAVIAEFPLALGVVGTVLAAPVAGIAAIVALLSDCTIEVERVEPVETPVLASSSGVRATPVDARTATTS